MDADMLQRRRFLGTACGTMGLLAMAGQAAGLSAAEATGRSVPADLQAARDRLMAELEAHRSIDVPRCDGEFLHLMVHVTAARHVLEVGTFRGYSGIWLGLGLEQTGGKLVTIDISPDRVKEARGNFTRRDWPTASRSWRAMPTRSPRPSRDRWTWSSSMRKKATKWIISKPSSRNCGLAASSCCTMRSRRSKPCSRIWTWSPSTPSCCMWCSASRCTTASRSASANATGHKLRRTCD